MTMRKFLQTSGLRFSNGSIEIPDYAQQVKVDVGLSVNAPNSQIWLEEDEKLLVIGFEPLRKNIDVLKSGNSEWPITLTLENQMSRFLLVPTALAEKHIEEGLDLYITGDDPGCSSLLPPANFNVIGRERVPIWSLNDFFECFSFERIPIIDHLKIDAQGFDFQILQGSTQILRKIFAITVEVDSIEYIGTLNSISAIDSLMVEFGFKKVTPGFRTNISNIGKGYRIELQTEDPTYINLDLISLSRTRRFFIYQHG